MSKRSERMQFVAWLAAVGASALAAFCTPATQPRAEGRAPQASVAPAEELSAVLRDEACLDESEASMQLVEQILARFEPSLDAQALRSIEARWSAPALAMGWRLRSGTRSCRRPPYCD